MAARITLNSKLTNTIFGLVCQISRKNSGRFLRALNRSRNESGGFPPLLAGSMEALNLNNLFQIDMASRQILFYMKSNEK